MRIFACWSLILIGLSLVGCRSPKGKTELPSATPLGSLSKSDRTFQTTANEDSRKRETSSINGVIAGRVIDESDQPISRAEIQVVGADDPLTGDAAPIERKYTTNDQGYFRIPGLQPGKLYQILVRGKSSGASLSGADYARAPDVSKLIQLKEEQRRAPAKAVRSIDDDNASRSVISGGITPAASIERPRLPEDPQPIIRSTPQEMPTVESREMATVPSTPSSLDRRQPEGHLSAPIAPPTVPNPRVPIVPKAKTPPLDRTINVLSSTGSKSHSIAPPSVDLLGSAPVPSAVVLGGRVRSFALKDLSGRPFYYPQDRRGKVTLLDFWKTDCPPCLASIPGLVRLQNDYGRDGLEIVGIACERGQGPERAQRASQIASRLRINYPVLLSTPAVNRRPGPVLRQLQIQALPTLILLDEDGNIIWDHVGQPSARDWNVLRREIERRLQ